MNNGFKVDPNGINFDKFNERAVLLHDHDYMHPIAWVEDLKFENEKLSCIPKFVDGRHTELFDMGVIVRAGMGGYVKSRDEDGNITEFELLEVSI